MILNSAKNPITAHTRVSLKIKINNKKKKKKKNRQKSGRWSEIAVVEYENQFCRPKKNDVVLIIRAVEDEMMWRDAK